MMTYMTDYIVLKVVRDDAFRVLLGEVFFQIVASKICGTSNNQSQCDVSSLFVTIFVDTWKQIITYYATPTSVLIEDISFETIIFKYSRWVLPASSTILYDLKAIFILLAMSEL